MSIQEKATQFEKLSREGQNAVSPLDESKLVSLGENYETVIEELQAKEIDKHFDAYADWLIAEADKELKAEGADGPEV